MAIKHNINNSKTDSFKFVDQIRTNSIANANSNGYKNRLPGIKNPYIKPAVITNINASNKFIFFDTKIKEPKPKEGIKTKKLAA